MDSEKSTTSYEKRLPDYLLDNYLFAYVGIFKYL